MCKEMPVIPVNRAVDPKRIIRKMEGLGGGEAQVDADPKKNDNCYLAFTYVIQTRSFSNIPVTCTFVKVGSR
jgi:hypothetical protein